MRRHLVTKGSFYERLADGVSGVTVEARMVSDDTGPMTAEGWLRTVEGPTLIGRPGLASFRG